MTGPEWIALLKQHAVELRSVGVLELHVDGASATLAPRDPEPSNNDAADEGEHADALMNPALYPGGVVPGYTRPEGDEGDE